MDYHQIQTCYLKILERLPRKEEVLKTQELLKNGKISNE